MPIRIKQKSAEHFPLSDSNRSKALINRLGTFPRHLFVLVAAAGRTINQGWFACCSKGLIPGCGDLLGAQGGS